MSDEQEQETPAWHAIVGDGWEPVMIGEELMQHDEVLQAGGWVVDEFNGGGLIYAANMRPRRRRRRSYDVVAIKDGINFCRVKAAKPGQCFMLTNNGELIPVDKQPTQSTE